MKAYIVVDKATGAAEEAFLGNGDELTPDQLRGFTARLERLGKALHVRPTEPVGELVQYVSGLEIDELDDAEGLPPLSDRRPAEPRPDYEGRREGDPEEARVLRKDGSELPLEPSLKVRRHSPTGFEWGYAGSGPAQLALALCLDVGLSAESAERVHQRVKCNLVAGLPREGWTLSKDQVREVVDAACALEGIGSLGLRRNRVEEHEVR